MTEFARDYLPSLADFVAAIADRLAKRPRHRPESAIREQLSRIKSIPARRIPNFRVCGGGDILDQISERLVEVHGEILFSDPANYGFGSLAPQIAELRAIAAQIRRLAAS